MMTLDDDAQVMHDDPPELAAALGKAADQDRCTRGAVRHQLLLNSDTEPDDDSEPAGAGPRGRGPPLYVGSHHRRRELCDGAGLCSLGRWAPWCRPPPRSHHLILARQLIMQYVLTLPSRIGITAEELFHLLAQGKVATDPLEKDALGLRCLIDQVQDALAGQDGSAVARSEDVAQPIRIRMLQRILFLGGDPDHRGMEHFCRGVRLGVGTVMPRTPAVYARKRKWRLDGQGDAAFDVEAERRALGGAWRDNYQSAKLHDKAILLQLEDAVERQLAIRLTEEEAGFHFPELTVNSLAGIAKLDEHGDVSSVRLVLDGTHGVVLNRAIRQRDQDRCPVASDVRRVQREQSTSRGAWGLALDVREAHRLPRVHPLDWTHQGCRSSLSTDLFVFTVGCFGVSSAAYWWSRLGGALVRAVHLLADPSDELWLLLMADDLKAESTSARPEISVLFVVLVLIVLGVPLSWHKSQGGQVIQWIGYEVHLAQLALGISQRRASWCVDFLLQLARDGQADIGQVRSGVGRLCFVVGALEWERPFLAPIFSFLSRQPKSGIRKLPLFVRVISHYLASRIALRRLYPSAVARRRDFEAFRIDASAEGDRIGVGGWLPVRNASGQLDRSLSPWFSFTLDERTAPWAYSRGLPYRTIASLEAVGVLVALIVFQPLLQRDTDIMYVMQGVTDNRGNQFTLSRLQSSKFPLCAILMEIAARSEDLRVRLSVDWVPRDMNEDADRLADGSCESFSPHLRRQVCWESMQWLVLDWALDLGQKFYDETSELKPVNHEEDGPRKRQKASYRETNPWSRKRCNNKTQ